MKHPHFEVDFKQRLTQSRDAREPVLAKAVGKKKYWVTPPAEPVVQKPARLGVISYGRAGGKSHCITVLKNRNTNPTLTPTSGGVHPLLGTQYSRYAIFDSWLNDLYPQVMQVHETRWLKEKQATLLRLQGYKVEECK